MRSVARYLVKGCDDATCCRPAAYVEKRFRRGEVVSINHSESGGATFVIEGLVARVRALRDGSRQIVSIQFPGDYISLGPVPDSPPVNAVALASCVVGCVDSSSTLHRVSKHPAAFIGWMNRDAAITQEWCAAIGQRRALARVAFLLCEFIVRTLQTGVAPNKLTIPLSQTDLGDCTGLTPVHVNRMVAELRKRRLIEIAHQRLSVLDFPRLMALAEFNAGYLGDPRVTFPSMTR